MVTDMKLKVPDEYADLVRPCDGCGKIRKLYKVELKGIPCGIDPVRHLCKTCLALEEDYCHNILDGWPCEGCENVHTDYVHIEDGSGEYLVCQHCGYRNEVHPCGEADEQSDEDRQEIKYAQSLREAIKKAKGENQ
jgi:hypothetical protein